MRQILHFAALPDTRSTAEPDAACIDDDRVALTNAEFATRVLAAAEAFRMNGVGAGDVVATLLSNRVELIVAMFAAWRLGAALTPINPSLTPGEATYQIEDSRARVVVHEGTDIEIAGVAKIGAAGLPVSPMSDDGGVTTEADAIALLIYTSGTTGKPKGVMLDHANLSAMAGTIVTELGLTKSDRCLLILPLFHVNGILVSVLSPLAAGASTTVTSRFSASTFFDTVEGVRPSYFSAVPAIYAMLSTLPEDIPPDTSSVRFAVCGAAPMPAELITRFEDRYGIPIVEGYGLSEGCCASTINPIAGPRKPGTVGRPLAGQDVKLLAEDGTVTTEGRGEVIVRGPNVMRGYLNQPDETARAFIAEWLRTGDVGYFDADGYLVLVDRVKDMIIRGGENIYPKEIESVLYGHPAVLEAAVVGKTHDVLGEEPVAFVALRSPGAASVDELRALCSSSLARYKVPRDVIILDMLPKNPVGKIAKPVLRELLTRASVPAT
jgi:acyl-CoA synthetase (AMP-forming)/AMP-acid ligase II